MPKYQGSAAIPFDEAVKRGRIVEYHKRHVDDHYVVHVKDKSGEIMVYTNIHPDHFKKYESKIEEGSEGEQEKHGFEGRRPSQQAQGKAGAQAGGGYRERKLTGNFDEAMKDGKIVEYHKRNVDDHYVVHVQTKLGKISTFTNIHPEHFERYRDQIEGAEEGGYEDEEYEE